MRLISIQAKNFRTLEDVVFEFGRAYCTISGRNNAGKSSLIRLVLALFGRDEELPPYVEAGTITYGDDKTQWAKSTEPIRVAYVLEVTEKEDPALLRFIERIAAIKLAADTVQLKIEFEVAGKGDTRTTAQISGTPVAIKRHVT